MMFMTVQCTLAVQNLGDTNEEDLLQADLSANNLEVGASMY